MSPEEKFAQRILEKHSAEPPVDVEKIIKNYAELLFKHIPISGIDGVSLNIKVPGKKPKIIVNSLIPITRQRFTLAHELGHVIIPWHIGEIIEDTINIDAQSAINHYEYGQMEHEANVFAAELLLPSTWLKGMFPEGNTVADFHKDITDTAQVSAIASAIKITRAIDYSIAFAEVNDDNKVINFGKSKSAHIVSLGNGEIINKNTFEFNGKISKNKIGRSSFYWWIFEGIDQIPDINNDGREWREILNQMISDLGISNKLKFAQSLNGVIAAANGKFKMIKTKKSIKELYSMCSQRLEREEFNEICRHKDFKIFLAKRVHDLFNK